MDVALKHIPIQTVSPVEAAQHVREQASCKVCSLALLTRTISSYETFHHSRVNCIVIQRTLIYAIPEGYGDYISALRCIYREASRFFCFVSAVLEFFRKPYAVFERIKNEVCYGRFPRYAFLTFEHGIIERIELDELVIIHHKLLLNKSAALVAAETFVLRVAAVLFRDFDVPREFGSLCLL